MGLIQDARYHTSEAQFFKTQTGDSTGSLPQAPLLTAPAGGRQEFVRRDSGKNPQRPILRWNILRQGTNIFWKLAVPLIGRKKLGILDSSAGARLPISAVVQERFFSPPENIG